MSLRISSPGSDEAGAVAIVSALTLTLLLLFAAFVIDLGFLRADRAAGQSVADTAAAAAVQGFDPAVTGAANEACKRALGYADANLATLPQVNGSLTAAVGDSCDEVFPDTEVCDSAVVKTATYSVGDFTVSITNPVRNGYDASDPADLMNGVNYDAKIDGSPCDRVGVEVRRTRGFHLAAAGGSERLSGETSMSAVARGGLGDSRDDYASLIVLHRQVCQALRAGGSGNAYVEVNARPDPDPTDPDTSRLPGVITVDTRDDGCGGNDAILRTDGANARIYAEDIIYSEQLRIDPSNTGIVFNPGDNIDPTPIPGERITRSPVDHVYNCLSAYPSDEHWSPAYTPWSVSSSGACAEAGEIPPYVEELHRHYQELTAAEAAAAGWQVISTCNNVNVSTSAARVYIDCPTGQGFRPNDVTFNNVEVVVSNNQIRNQDDLTIMARVDTGAILYLQEGRLSLESQSVTTLNSVFVYVDGEGIGNNQSPLGVGGQASLTWHAPLAANTGLVCEAYNAAWAAGTAGAPPAACFAPLALWSNHEEMHDLGGGGGVVTSGSFFTPNAQPFRLRGGSGSDYTDSQFFSAMIDVGGGGTITLVPNPDTNIPTQPAGTGLIR